MTIDFNEIKKQNIDSDALIHLIEVMYNEIKNASEPNIIFNEYVDSLEVDKKTHATFSFYLSKAPISSNDIQMVSEDGGITVTPSSIVELNGNKVTFKNLQINSDTALYITYKY
ncbi:MAG: hypothetical protein ACRCZ9_01225 [Fusobacteriaceae bacterium]